MKRILFVFTVLFGMMAFAQEASLTIGQLIDQVIQEIFALKASPDKMAMGIGGLALVVRVLLSTMKVSILRPLWDKLPDNMKNIVPVALGFILSLLMVQPLTAQSILVACVGGSAAIPLHHLLKAVESLPGVNKSVLAVIELAQKLLGGK